MEELTKAIAGEYQKRAKGLGDDANIAGERYELVHELMDRCGIPEIWAINILNGIHIKDYLKAIEMQAVRAEKVGDEGKREFLEWQAEKETNRMLQEEIEKELDGMK